MGGTRMVWAGLVIASFAGPGAALGERGAQPNIILIMADDAGFELFPSYGGESYAMPALDALAATGMQFNHCYSQPVCAPTRCKIMTGKYNFRNYTDWGRIEPGDITFSNVLRDAGYATAVAGKWDLWDSSYGISPQDAGFDEHLVHEYLGHPEGSRYWQPRLYLNDVEIETAEDDFGPDLFRDFVIDFMTAHQDEPFFIYYPMVLVHIPLVRTPDSTDEETLFADMVAYMDKIVGQIVTAVDDLGLSEDTIIMFTTDNGTDAITSRWNGQNVTGHKFHPDDLGNRVPLYVNWEGRTPDGAVSDDLVCLSDFMPTLGEAAGVAVPKDVDGQSFLPQVRGETGTPRTFMYSWYQAKGTNTGGVPAYRFARTQRWKLYDDNRLFDVANDLHERTPYYLDQNEEHEAMRAFLQGVMDEIEVDLPPADLTGNAIVDLEDLLHLLNKWGPCGNPCRGNLNEDDVVDFLDLLILLSDWTPL